jgi:hypothetical protein
MYCIDDSVVVNKLDTKGQDNTEEIIEMPVL